MCLRDSPTSLCPFGPVGPNTFVKISIDWRRVPFSASPSTVSAPVFAYTSAVSNVEMPASSAACTLAIARSFSTWLAAVTQLP